MKETAVEWLVNEANLLENNGWILPLIEKANKMFEQQVIDAWKDGAYGGGQFTTTFDNEKQYYNETFKNK
jgi:hypothetical protein